MYLYNLESWEPYKIRHNFLLGTDSLPSHLLVKATITSSAFDYLCELNQNFKSNGASLALIENRICLRLDHYVGVIQTPCGTQIEILPKVFDEGSSDEVTQQTRDLLQRMVANAFQLKPREVGAANVQLFNAPITEWLMQHFLQELELLVKKGLRFDYLRIEDEQRFLRGQLNTTQQMRQPPGKQHFFHIRYDEMNPNSPENRLLKTALEIVAKVTQDSANWKRATELRSLMADIPSSHQIAQDLAKWRNTRLMSHYKQVKPWCELIVKKLTPMSVKGNWHGLSLLYPMNMLFEKYVATWLHQNVIAGTELTFQASIEYLTLHNGSKMFNLMPDFLLTAGNKKWVLDAKWKILDQNNPKDNYNLSQQDLYQLFAYGHKYLAQQDSQELFLIYPQCKTFDHALKVFEYGNGMSLWVVPFDLENNKLIDVGGKNLPLLAF